MLLPIVLLLASAGPIRLADQVAATQMENSATTKQARTLLPNSGPNTFVHERRGERVMPDQGIIIPANGNGCMSITAYVFSDGENPELKYVTHCPNLVVPYETKRAHRNEPDSDHQPTLRRTGSRE